MSMQTSTHGNALYADKIIAAVDEARDELVDISLDIHAHPELNYEEYHASALLADTLERHGFYVERGVGGVETAFRGTLSGAKGDGPTVADHCPKHHRGALSEINCLGNRIGDVKPQSQQAIHASKTKASNN